MPSEVTIRTASPEDSEYLTEIYRPYVENTAISFEYTVPNTDEFAKRISASIDAWAWLVAEVDGEIAGYAYGSQHRPREAYKYSAETSAYVRDRFQRQGIARLLYAELLSKLAEKGYRNAFAGVSLPNTASVKFHEHMGFDYIGVFPRVGYKFDRWHDVAWYNKILQT